MPADDTNDVVGDRSSGESYRLPAHAPTSSAREDLVRWEALSAAAAERVISTAQTWRAGLAGFVTLLTSVLLLKGADLVDVAVPQRYVVVGLVAAGAAAAVWGLWAALSSEAPVLSDVGLEEVRREHGSVFAYQRSVQRRSTQMLARARRRVFGSLVLLLFGSVAWWISPTTASPDARLRIAWTDRGSQVITCGAARPAPVGSLLLDVAGAEHPVLISLTTVSSIDVVGGC